MCHTRRLCCLLALASMFGNAACRWPGQPVAAEFTSPQGTYTVKLRGHVSAPRSPFFEHYLYVEAFKGHESLVTGHEVHFADWFDTAFEDMYGETEWTAENILRFKFVTTESPKGLDEVVIENQSDRGVRFLRLSALDLFLCFNLPPKSNIHLKATPQALLGPLGWFSADGRWENGTELPSFESNHALPRPGSRSQRYAYKIVIREDAILLRDVTMLGQEKK